jgi:hypothetical protein
MGEYEFRARLNMLLPQYPETAKDNFYYKCLPNFTLKDKRNQTKLENELALIQPRLLVVDNHASFHGGDPNRENEMMVNVVLPFREIMAKFNLGILYLMHTPWLEKDRPRGSAAIFDAAGTVVAVTKTQEKVRQVEWKKRRSVRRRMGISKIDLGYDEETFQIYRLTPPEMQEILDSLSYPILRKLVVQKIQEGFHISQSQAYKRVTKLITNGFLKAEGKDMVNRTTREKLVGIIKSYEEGEKRKEMDELGI